MLALALFFVVTPALAHGQTSSPSAAAAAPAAAAPAEKTAAQTASPEVVGALVSELGITATQAEGAAATLFGVAKTKLSPADFGKVAATVPNMDGLLKAAPKASSDSLAGKAMASLGGVGSAAAAASALSKLGLKPETIVKVAPALVKVVQSKGGAEVASLLAGALK